MVDQRNIFRSTDFANQDSMETPRRADSFNGSLVARAGHPTWHDETEFSVWSRANEACHSN